MSDPKHNWCDKYVDMTAENENNIIRHEKCAYSVQKFVVKPNIYPYVLL